MKPYNIIIFNHTWHKKASPRDDLTGEVINLDKELHHIRAMAGWPYPEQALRNIISKVDGLIGKQLSEGDD